MEFVAKRINERNGLHGIMAYQVKCPLPHFFAIRIWCWDAFGPGIEHEHYLNYLRFTGISMPWCWDVSKFRGASIDNGKIYLSTDDQMRRFSEEWL